MTSIQIEQCALIVHHDIDTIYARWNLAIKNTQKNQYNVLPVTVISLSMRLINYVVMRNILSGRRDIKNDDDIIMYHMIDIMWYDLGKSIRWVKLWDAAEIYKKQFLDR